MSRGGGGTRGQKAAAKTLEAESRMRDCGTRQEGERSRSLKRWFEER